MPRRAKNSKKANSKFYSKSIAISLVISVLLLLGISFFNDIVSGEIFWDEVQILTYEDFLPIALEDDFTTVNVLGIGDVLFDILADYDREVGATIDIDPHTLHIPNLEDLRNPATLQNAMYIVNNLTLFVPEMFDVDAFVARDMRVNPVSLAAGYPVVLIFHTHSTEMFVDSNPVDKFTGIVGVGAYLADILNSRGIPTIHYTRRFDVVDGVPNIWGAYERQESHIRRILYENPTIEVIIDMHRDGLPETAPRLVTNIDGTPTARLMFVNGLSTRNVNGVAVPISYLPNPNQEGNLAFSFQMQVALNESHPNLNRRIFLNAFRYSTHFLPKSLLLEVGDQRNTQREAKNAMYPFADALIRVITE